MKTVEIKASELFLNQRIEPLKISRFSTFEKEMSVFEILHGTEEKKKPKRLFKVS